MQFALQNQNIFSTSRDFFRRRGMIGTWLVNPKLNPVPERGIPALHGPQISAYSILPQKILSVKSVQSVVVSRLRSEASARQAESVGNVCARFCAWCAFWRPIPFAQRASPLTVAFVTIA